MASGLCILWRPWPASEFSAAIRGLTSPDIDNGENLTLESVGDSRGLELVRVYGMRIGISIEVSPANRDRLDAIVADRNSPQKDPWRARRSCPLDVV
jgi:hypothetical protein